MNPFAYDFGYGFGWNYGHVIPLVVFGALTTVGLMRGWARWITAIPAALAVWSAVGLAIVQLVVRMNLPLELPTDRFLAEGTGTVLDAGAGSGRSSLMVLLGRPESRVLALDLYEGYFGIDDNNPDRLLANASRAGVADRIETKVGDVREMPLSDDSLDAAVSAYVIDHLSQEGVERSLSEIRRVVRPGGEFLLMVIKPDAWIRVAYPMFAEHGYFGADHSARWARPPGRRRLRDPRRGNDARDALPAGEEPRRGLLRRFPWSRGGTVPTLFLRAVASGFALRDERRRKDGHYAQHLCRFTRSNLECGGAGG